MFVSVILHKKPLAFVALAVLGVCFLLFKNQTVLAANPQVISFQGKVVNADGTNVTNGTYSFDFVLYDDLTLGSPSDGVHDKWHELGKSVTVTNGVFQTNLGSATALPDFNANPSLYLAVRFNSDAAGYMTPRIQMGSVPYALNSDSLGGVSKDGFVQLGPAAVQTDATTNSSIFINKTGASGNIIQLQRSGTDVLALNNSGQLSLQPAADGNALQVSSNGGVPLLTVNTSSGNVQVGNTVADSSGSQLVVDTKNTAGDPTGVNGGIYYNSSSGTLRCYQNNTWEDCLTASGNATTSIISGRANVTANQTGLNVETLVFTSATGVSNTAGATGFTAPAAGSFRTCLIKNNAAITAGNLDLRWRVNGTSVGSAACQMNSTDNRSSASAVAGGTVTFAQGDTIGVAFDTDSAFSPSGSTDYTVFWTVEYYSTSSNPSGATLQSAYDNGATINMTDGHNFLLNAADTATDPSVLVNLQCTTSCGSNGRFAVQNGGIDVFSVSPNGGLVLASNNSASGVIIQDSSNSNNIFGVDTSGDQVILGQQGTSGVNGKLVFNTTNASNTSITLAAASTASSYSLTLPTTGPAVSQCLQTDGVTASQLIFSSCGGSGDNISVNSAATTDADFTDVAATGTVTGTAWTLNAGPNPDTITLGISNASVSVAGAVTTGAQTFAGDKTFNGQIGASNLGVEFTESDTNPTCASGNYNIYADASDARIKKCQNGVVSDVGQDADVINRAKSADQSVTNSTTLVDETALQFNLGASEEWNVIWNLVVSNNNSATPDWKAAVAGPASVSCMVLQSGAEPSGAAFPQSTTTNCTTPGTLVNGAINASATPFIVNITANVAGGGTAGTVKVQFAENTGGAGTSITVKEGSVMNAYRVTGADLAEFYSSNDTSLVPGDVVSLDPSLDAGVKKSTSAYDASVMGVISTKPGVVMGSSSKDSGGIPVLLALSGRVPVKVNQENGPIKAGDLLTPSSTPGVAMKATKPGPTIGMAMNGYSGQGLGMVTMFIKNSYAPGSSQVSAQNQDTESLEKLLGTTSTEQTKYDPSQTQGTISYLPAETNEQKYTNIVARPSKLISFSGDLDINGTITADKVKADQIEGLEIITGKITGLENKINAELSDEAPAAKAVGGTTPLQTTLPSLKITGGLTVEGDVEFHGNALFAKIVTFVEKTVFRNDVTFGGHILTDGNSPTIHTSVGKAELNGNDNTGSLSVAGINTDYQGEIAQITFAHPYAKAPQISLTAANADSANARYFVESTAEGFKLTLTTPSSSSSKYKFTYLVVQ